MDDEKIIELYWHRDETAITRTDEKYGRLCRKIACSILLDSEDGEECVADTYLALWDSIPPKRPQYFRAFIAAITRNLSLKRLRTRNALCRGGEAELALEELGDMLASGTSVERDYERRELTQAIDTFLHTLPESDRSIFVCRYWLFAPTADIAAKLGFSQSKVTTSLYRTRQKLRKYLEKEELI